MFHGRNPDAAVHQRSRIGDSRDRSDIRAKFEIIEIDAAKNDAFARRRGQDANGGVFAGMKPDSTEFDCGLAIVCSCIGCRHKQFTRLNSIHVSMNNLRTKRGLKPCTFVHSVLWISRAT